MEGEFIVNPETGRMLRKGSARYEQLMRKLQKQQILEQQQQHFSKQQSVPKISKAYTALNKHVQQSNVIDEPVEKKRIAKTILKDGVKAYKKTLETLPADDEFENEDELEAYIKAELVKNLKSQNNKYINEFLDD